MKKKIVIPLLVFVILLVVICLSFLNKNDLNSNVDYSQTVTATATEAVSKRINTTRTTLTQEPNTAVDEKRDKNGKMIELTVGDSKFVYSSDTKTLTVTGETVDIPVMTDYWSKNVEKIVFNKGVRFIEESFSNYEKVKIIEFSDTVKEINTYIFSYKSNLEKIVVSSDNVRYYTDKFGNLYDRIEKKLIRMPTLSKQSEYSIPDGIEEIDWYAFEECVNLKKVYIGEKFSGDLYQRFYYCPSLEKIEVHKNNLHYASDSQGAVYDKKMSILYGVPSQIEEYKFPESVVEITGGIARELSGIKTVYFSDNCDYISEVLYMFNNLEKIVVEEGNKLYSTKDGVLFNSDKTQMVYYPPMKKDIAYNIPSSVTEIIRIGGKKLKIIVIPDNVKIINSDAFIYCESVEYIRIGKGLELIEVTSEFGVENENPFALCDNLKRITVDRNNRNYKSDSYGALYTSDMKNLLTVPANAELKEYTVPDTVVYIFDCFKNCSKIEVINIGASVKFISIGEEGTECIVGFADCVSLQEINVSDKNVCYESVDGILYENEFNTLALYPAAKKGTTYSVPLHITRISDFAFLNNKYLEKVFVHKNVSGNHYGNFACDSNGLMFDLYYEGTEDVWKRVEEYEINHKIYYNSKGF